MDKTNVVHHPWWRAGRVDRTENADGDYYTGCLIEWGHVSGLSAVQTGASTGNSVLQGRCQVALQIRHRGRAQMPNTRWLVYAHRQ